MEITQLRELRRARSDRGFTLIELLIIIAILGVLAAIVVFAVLSEQAGGTVAACQSNYKTTEMAAEAYKAQIGSYPTDFAQLTVAKTGETGQLDGPWLKEQPNTYTPKTISTPASITDGAAYGLAVDTATQSIAVGTIKANGAESDSGSPLVDGNANCSNA